MNQRLLFLSHRVPFPPHSGAAIRGFNVMRELSQDFTIDALCFHRVDSATAGQSLADRVRALNPYARCEAFSIPQQESAIRMAWDHSRSIATWRPYTWYLHSSATFQSRLSALLATNDYDVIHVDSLDMVRFLEHLPLDIVACTHHNIESNLLARRAAMETYRHRELYLAHQARLVERMERRWAPRVALNLCTSADDAALLERLAPSASTAIVPNGVDDDYFSPQPVVRDQGLVFVGGTSWYPNKDALNWFVEEILPALREAGVSAPVTWVGRVTEAEQAALAHVRGLRLTGYVDDVRPFLAHAECFVAPIRVGGGTRLKILDAWAMGTPVVGTRSAMEGLDAETGTNFLRAESAADFCAAVKAVLSDGHLAARLGASGRKTVESTYSWKRIGSNLRRYYSRLAQTAKDRDGTRRRVATIREPRGD